MKTSPLSVLFILMCVMTIALRISAIPDICIYKNRQLTVGQTYIDCYNKVTCRKRGIMEIKKACRAYTCEHQSKWIGYKPFDPSKPYPDCCGGSICSDGRIIYLNTPVKTHNQRDPSNVRLV